MGLVGAVCAWLRSCYNRPVLKMPALAQDACPSTSFPTTQLVDKDLMDMLVRELKDELEARSESKTGNKAWLLRRQLHGAIVRDHLDAAA
jgi:hypothetical protein